MFKIIIRTSNNNFTTLAIESIPDQGYTYFYWRKVNECRTRFVGRYDSGAVANFSVNEYAELCKEIARMADGEFIGVCNG